MVDKNRGELKVGEPHPASIGARDYIKQLGLEKLCTYQEAFASASIEGNRLSEICLETLDRLITGKPVSDRYLLGLAWTIRGIEEKK